MIQAFARNMRTYSPLLREKSKGTHHKDESTDVEHRDGGIRSSDETTVMVAEQRDSVIATLIIGQP